MKFIDAMHDPFSDVERTLREIFWERSERPRRPVSKGTQCVRDQARIDGRDCVPFVV